MSTNEKEPRCLTTVIKEMIAEKGEITFRDFMDVALYHPGLGYYMSEKLKIGKEGDFYTSPDVHSVFGKSIMKELVEMKEIISPADDIYIIEAGAGKGGLALQILDSAKENAPAMYGAISYIIVEKSPTMMEIQKESLYSSGHKGKVLWHESMSSALAKTDTAIILTNELLDALPVHRARFDGKIWEELYVGVDNDHFVETTGPISKPELKHFLGKLEGPFDEDYITEVNLDAINWGKEVGENLNKGFVITIDYGYPEADYYSPLRNRGTLLCYYKHTTNDNPYENVGKQDITAHVNFTSIAEAGMESGLDVTGYCEQFHFLMGLGIFDEFKENDSERDFNKDAFQDNLAIKKLLMPEGMGGTFKVLIQHKGIEKPKLKAFSFKDLSHRL